jgi:predicted HTH domain antitoxin
VLEAVAVEAYRSGTITLAPVQQMLSLHSRWETETFLRRAEAYHDYTVDDLERDIVQFAPHPRDDRGRGHFAALLPDPHR